jgi:hypothetical protein
MDAKNIYEGDCYKGQWVSWKDTVVPFWYTI